MLVIRGRVWAVLLTLLFLIASGSSRAQSVFDTGETQRSYSYFQVQYLLDQDPIKNPFLFTILLDVGSGFSLTGEYLDLTADFDNIDEFGNINRVSTYIIERKLGVNYHRQSTRWSRVDWLVSLLYDSILVGAEATDGTKIEITSNGVDLELGARASLLPSLEAQLVVLLPYFDGAFQDEVINATVVYRLLNQLDLALGARNLDDPNYSVGLRYVW